MNVAPEAPLQRCAPAAEERGDSLYGTAAPAQRFVLVEQPGAWGRDALHQSPLDPQVGEALAVRAKAVQARVLLLRRVRGRPRRASRRWALADARPGHERTWWGEFDDDAQLLEVPLDGSVGVETAEPTYLVCTHGRHDACCAIRGWPVALALAEEYPQQTWQCSHVGGDRFAANVVVLPHGLYYGFVTAASALELAGAYREGRVVTDLLRGRSAFGVPVQAAQHHARVALGEAGLDRLAPLEAEQLDERTWRVRLTHLTGELEVVVRAHVVGPMPRVTCAAVLPGTAREYRLVALEQAGVRPR